MGGAANVALNLQSLGAEPILCAMLGDDEEADIFEGLLKKGILVEMALSEVKIESRLLKNAYYRAPNIY